MTKHEINNRLIDEKNSKGILIATHRGASGGNIIENTIPAFEAALLSGTDIVEMDVIRTTDGKLYIFHDGMEPRLFWSDKNVKTMTAKEVEALRFVNQNSNFMSYGPPKLDDVLEQFKGRCLINLDRCWWCWDSVFEAVLRHGMEDQILFKSPVKQEYLDLLKAQTTPFMYLPIAKTLEDVALTDHADVNTVAVEVIFKTDDSPLIDDAFLQGQHKKGRLLWANAIRLADEKPLTAGHDDDHSILIDPNEGWGYLVQKGFNIIQTDWPGLLKQYLAYFQ